MTNHITKPLGWGRGKYALAALSLILGIAASGCSSIADNPSTPAPEPDVRNYYLHLATTNCEYNYTVTSNAPYHPASGGLTMSMQGNTDTFQNMPIYACLWSYSNTNYTPQRWYYALCDTQAVALGLEPSADNYTDSWVDLKAPLQKNATWSFTSQGEQITANVTMYGGTAQVEGKTYDDVVMVQYTGVKGTTGTQWFARGTGLIFSHIERPNFGMVENHLLSIEQK
ncbi:MAG TPA: hypothetical protein VFX22_08215 [Candidatus Kapabacteria bacterium]|nr:hypothetical protein [Candidatus Kapabacteria bacterium]